MHRQTILILSILLPAALSAQVSDSILFPGARRSVPDTLAVPMDTLRVPAEFVSEPGSFRQGKGVEVDTLDIQDGRLLLVLKDDHTLF